MPHKHEQLIKSQWKTAVEDLQHFHLIGPLSAKIRQFIKTAISQIKKSNCICNPRVNERSSRYRVMAAAAVVGYSDSVSGSSFVSSA